MRDVEERAEQVLAAAPAYVWDGDRLPVPIEDIVDSVYGLLVRDVDDMRAAPGAPALGAEGRRCPASCYPREARSGSMPRKRGSPRDHAGASRSDMSWATG